MTYSHDVYEVRLYGLTTEVVPADLEAPFARVAPILDIRLHREADKFAQWAVLTVATEAEAEGCMGFKEQLQKLQVTMTGPFKIPARQSGPLVPATARNSLRDLPLSYHPVPPLLPGYRSEPTLSYRNANPAADLPTNLYVLNLPKEMDLYTFGSMFTLFGMVEHYEILTKDDGMGRRRGFIIMETHREAAEVMMALNGKWIDGFRIDVSWALKQLKPHEIKKRKAEQLADRVNQPPPDPAQTEYGNPAYCSVIIEGLDLGVFSDTTSIQDLFSHFGPVNRVTIIPGQAGQVIVGFTAAHTARNLVNQGWIAIGAWNIRVKPLVAVSTFEEGITPPRRSSFQSLHMLEHPHASSSPARTHYDSASRYQNQGSNYASKEPSWFKAQSQLNPASQVFVPTSMTLTSHPAPLSNQDINIPRESNQSYRDVFATSQSGSHRTHGSHTSNDNSKTSKTSSKTSNMSKNSSASIPVSQVEDEGLKMVKEIWSRPDLWCELSKNYFAIEAKYPAESHHPSLPLPAPQVCKIRH